MVVIAMMLGQLLQVGVCKFARAVTANPGVDLLRPLPISHLAQRRIFVCFCNDAIQPRAIWYLLAKIKVFLLERVHA